ncbi:MAG: hypothetical protein ACRDNG_04525 [Gaiellaceae bacterium]
MSGLDVKRLANVLRERGIAPGGVVGMNLLPRRGAVDRDRDRIPFGFA